MKMPEQIDSKEGIGSFEDFTVQWDGVCSLWREKRNTIEGIIAAIESSELPPIFIEVLIREISNEINRLADAFEGMSREYGNSVMDWCVYEGETSPLLEALAKLSYASRQIP